MNKKCECIGDGLNLMYHFHMLMDLRTYTLQPGDNPLHIEDHINGFLDTLRQDLDDFIKAKCPTTVPKNFQLQEELLSKIHTRDDVLKNWRELQHLTDENMEDIWLNQDALCNLITERK